MEGKRKGMMKWEGRGREEGSETKGKGKRKEEAENVKMNEGGK